MDSPEAGKGETAQDGGDDLVGDEQGCRDEREPGEQPDPPPLFPQVILHLDDGRMADPDAEEDACADNYTTESHSQSILGDKYR